MNDILELAKFYLASLAFGVFWFVPVADSKKTGGGFQKLLSTVCACSLFGAIILNLVGNGMNAVASLVILVVSLVLILIHRQLHHFFDQKIVLNWIIYFIVSLIGIYYFIQTQSFHLLNSTFVLSSVFFLGVITYEMLLGHWYLVTPKLSERPLLITTYFSWAIILPKIIWSLVSTYNASAYLEEFTTLGGGYSFNWMMILMRGIWGYLVIAIMSYFGWRLVKMRSIQSATGIFYSMTIFIFIGELISSYLFIKFGLLI